MSSSVLRQKDEMTAMMSIFHKEVEFTTSAENGASAAGQFHAFVELPTTLELVVNVCSNVGPNVETANIRVSYLPPLVLHFSLPEDYPSHPKSPPAFTLTCQWLDRKQLSILCHRLDCLWEFNVDFVNQEGTEILFVWSQFLKYEALEYLQSVPFNNLTLDISTVEELYIMRPHANSKPPDGEQEVLTNPNCEDSSTLVPVDHWAIVVLKTNKSESKSEMDRRAIFEFTSKSSILEFLQEYNKIQMEATFNRQFHACNICIENKVGFQCVTFMPCNHVFCKECTTSYLSSSIADGKIQNITCPDTLCTSDAQFNQIKELISPELFEKFDKLLLDATLFSLGDVVNCPRAFCQYPVTLNLQDKVACCYYCRYAFCVDCRRGYHGVEPCRMDEEQCLVDEYISGTKLQRMILEKRHSRRKLEMLVQNSKTKEWIASNSKNCPKCNATIEKSFGCNKMQCVRCSTRFCWLCCTKLDPEDPYAHFQTPGSPCFQLLFEGVDMNNDDDDDDDDDGDGNNAVDIHGEAFQRFLEAVMQFHDYVAQNDIAGIFLPN